MLFSLASADCALAPNAADLVVARTVQGIGAAAVLPLSLTILTTAFPPQRRGMIVGIYGGLAGLAVASGPVVGGVVTEGLDWHWIFWLNVPIGLVATTLATRLLPESLGASERLDLAGVALVTAGVVALVWALVRANDVGWSSTEIISTLVAGRALLVAGIGVSMALPAVPTAVLSSVAEIEMGKASGINYMAQRFGAVFAIAVASAVFSAHGNLSGRRPRRRLTHGKNRKGQCNARHPAPNQHRRPTGARPRPDRHHRGRRALVDRSPAQRGKLSGKPVQRLLRGRRRTASSPTLAARSAAGNDARTPEMRRGGFSSGSSRGYSPRSGWASGPNCGA